jgi:hypothetical protein
VTPTGYTQESNNAWRRIGPMVTTARRADPHPGRHVLVLVSDARDEPYAAGTLEGGKLGFAADGLGRQLELQAVAACVLSCALAGGRISRAAEMVHLSAPLDHSQAALSDRALRDWALRGR